VRPFLTPNAERDRTEPGFTLRSNFHGRPVEIRWAEGQLLEAPDELRAEVAELVATRRWVERDLAHPWREEGGATMVNRWLAQAVLLALLEPDSIELDDPVLEAEAQSWPDDSTF
jgi:hypothetical protein